MDDYREKTDEFFYDNYMRAWEGAEFKKMIPIYKSEMEALICSLEKKMPYRQEFAKDYLLKLHLTKIVDGKKKAVQIPPSPYSIASSEGTVLFQKDGKTVYQCTYKQFFKIINNYAEQLKNRFWLEGWDVGWIERLDTLKKARRDENSEERTSRRKVVGDKNATFEKKKSLTLKPGDIDSLKQLKCQDTLRYLVMNGLTKVKDLNVLSEYTNLRTLYMRSMDIEDISFISTLTNITELGLPGNKITDLSPLENLKNLDHLYIADNPVTDFSVVEKLPGLKVIYTDINQMPDSVAWDKIPKHVALRVLSLIPIGDFYYESTEVYKRNIELESKKEEEAGNAGNLAANGKNEPEKKSAMDSKHLQIRDRWLYSGLYNSLGYTPSVKYDLTKVKTLSCADNIRLVDDFLFLNELGDYSCLEAAVNLRDLNLSNRVINDFQWLKNCVNLKRLDLSHTDFDDLTLLLDMKKLTNLSLAGCKNLKKEDGDLLKELTSIKVLDLANTPLFDKSIFPTPVFKTGVKPSADSVGIFGKPKAFHSGFSLEEILEAENRIGVKLPKVYRNYLKIYGKDAVNTKCNSIMPPCDIDTSYNYIDYTLVDWEDEFKDAKKEKREEEYADNEYYRLWSTPPKRWKEITDNYLLIWYENRGVWYAGYKLSDLSQEIENPPIYITTNDDFVSFRKCCDSTEEFLNIMFEVAEANPKELPLVSLLNEIDVFDNSCQKEEDTAAPSKRVEKLVNWIKDKTKTVSYKLIANHDKPVTLTSSKLGGLPYWDGSRAYPVSANGDKLVLLSQINLSDLPEDSPFPKSGLLQFFIAADEMLGLSDGGYSVIYHKNIDYTVSEDDVRKSGIPTCDGEMSEEVYFPIENEVSLSVESCFDSINTTDFRFDELFRRAVLFICNEDIGMNDCYDYLDNEEQNYLDDELRGDGHKMLGYGYFTQWDPREDEENKRFDTTLLQIDSDEDVMWGDCGVGNFFISREDLEKENFTDVLFNWDCC